MSGKNLKRRKRPKPEKAHVPYASPAIGHIWIRDIQAKVTYFPKDMAAFRKTYRRLTCENRVITTSHHPEP
jgi:hypothetical protein